MDQQRSGSLRGMVVVEEHFAFQDVPRCFPSYVDAATAAVVVVVGDVRQLVRGLAMLVQEAVSSVVFIGYEYCGSRCDFLQGRDGKGRAQLACSWPARCSGDSLVMAVWMSRVHPGSGRGWKVMLWWRMVSVASDATTAPAICSHVARIRGGWLAGGWVVGVSARPPFSWMVLRMWKMRCVASARPCWLCCAICWIPCSALVPIRSIGA